MNVVSFTEARASLKTVMDRVGKDHVPALITRVSGDHMVLLSLDDFNGMQETMHLLASPKNAKRLSESIAQLRAGSARPRNFKPHEHAKIQKQAAG